MIAVNFSPVAPDGKVRTRGYLPGVNWGVSSATMRSHTLRKNSHFSWLNLEEVDSDRIPFS
ncbi:MAG TPA: hypothetical protein V6D30_02370 [Leptolyngbyaceae cyanobacterium]